MEWMKLIGDSIQYIEEHLLDDVSVESISKHIGVSPFYFQKGFSMLCGFTVAEYIRNRRLALAGNEIIGTDHTIIDVALKYGYDSPDSFTKAFTRFHGATPTAVRNEGATIKAFAALKINVSLKGGYTMDYKIEEKGAFTVLGVSKTFSYDEAQKEVPRFWNEHYKSGKGKYVCGMY